MGYAVVLGEALIDLLDGECAGERVFRQAIGGAPFNVSVGAARLGGQVSFAGSLGDDALGTRILDYLKEAGVDDRAAVRVPVPTTLAVVTFSGADPEFHFYGSPPSYSLLTDVPADLLAGSAVVYCGSIVLLHPEFRAAARTAWSTAGGLRVFDPNVRPTLLPTAADVDALRTVVEEFCATADLVKLSHADAAVLYPGLSLASVAGDLLSLGAGAVVVTRGPAGALVAVGDERIELAAPVVEAVDATGAGDSVMAALIAGLLADGRPATATGWTNHVAYALQVAGLVCERPGGAVAMPTRAEVAARYGSST
ncbi:carbohydrate kinase [Asanoa sp. WMMD1127]|uniref:carbohydrate kinase family protein n=1 Tax=Asanoa sp. WMMD1127 TaxID=3016107 RepID=UPI002416FF0D|nr:carbohydrate kinase [Asanoa sp. WMMD1127]MDG4826736.1 carbohydrate kinase [Asanoa sp. WMMD1127]